MINGNRKGKAGERELCKALANATGLSYRRTQQYNGTGLSDVVCEELPELHIECKRGKVVNIHKALEQVERDRGVDQLPLVCTRRDHDEWNVTIPLKHLAAVVEALGEAMEGGGK